MCFVWPVWLSFLQYVLSDKIKSQKLNSTHKRKQGGGEESKYLMISLFNSWFMITSCKSQEVISPRRERKLHKTRRFLPQDVFSREGAWASVTAALWVSFVRGVKWGYDVLTWQEHVRGSGVDCMRATDQIPLQAHGFMQLVAGA